MAARTTRVPTTATAGNAPRRLLPLCWGSADPSDGEGVESLGRSGMGDIGERWWKEGIRKWKVDGVTYNLGLSASPQT